MPYSTTESAEDCDGIAVIKDNSGKVMGCHETEAAAQEQIAAIEASEDERALPDVEIAIPDRVEAAAQAALDAKAEYDSISDCGGEAGRGEQRAEQIVSGDLAAADFVTRQNGTPIPAYLDSHSEDLTADGAPTTWTEEEWTDGCGNVQYALWGWDRDWAEAQKEKVEDAIDAQDDDRTMRADPEDLSVGDRVEWDASGGTAYGEVETIETDGTISAEPEGPSMEGSEEEPAIGVRVFQPGEDGWEASDVLVVHRADALAKIDSFPDEEAGGMAEDEDRGWTGEAEIRMASDGERTTVQVMTEDIARDGMVLRADGVDTSAYMSNPVVLWNHGQDPQRGAIPIARTVDMQRVDGGIRATVEWDDDAFSQEIKRKVKNGFLSAVSIGWRTEDSEQQEIDGRSVPVVTEADMTEFSFVSVPADAGALVVQRSRDDLESLLRSVVREEVRALKTTIRDAATAATPRTDPEPPATAEGSAEVQRDDTPDEETLDADDLVRKIDRIINRKLGKI